MVDQAPPIAPPSPNTIWSAPAGSPASCSVRARRSAESGVFSAGLSTTGHPAAIAGASLWATRLSGKLKGLIAPTTPTGSRIVKASLPAPEALEAIGTTFPASPRASAAANVNVSRHRAASARACAIGLAASRQMVSAKASARAPMRAAARSSTSARACGSGGGRWRAAVATAVSTSEASATGSRASSDPS